MHRNLLNRDAKNGSVAAPMSRREGCISSALCFCCHCSWCRLRSRGYSINGRFNHQNAAAPCIIGALRFSRLLEQLREFCEKDQGVGSAEFAGENTKKKGRVRNAHGGNTSWFALGMRDKRVCLNFGFTAGKTREGCQVSSLSEQTR